MTGGEVHQVSTPGADQMEEGFNRGGNVFIEGVWRRHGEARPRGPLPRDDSDYQPGGALWKTVGQDFLKWSWTCIQPVANLFINIVLCFLTRKD